MENHSNNHVLFIIALPNIYASVCTEHRSVRNGSSELTELKQVYCQTVCDGQSRCQLTEGMSLNKAYPRLIFHVTPAFAAIFRDRRAASFAPLLGWCTEVVFPDSDK